MPKGQYTRKFKEIAGEKFGKLTAIKIDGKKGRHYLYECRCDCGKTRSNVYKMSLLNGEAKSCGCENPEYFKNIGLSEKEYFEKSKERLLKKRIINNDCWEWTGYLDDKGYGRLTWGQSGKKKTWIIPRLAYLLWKGPIEENLDIMHSCDNPKCFNPDHLSSGSRLENMTQAAVRNRVGMRKLKPDQIPQIREMREKGMTYKKIGEKFSVTGETINAIFLGKTWSHIK